MGIEIMFNFLHWGTSQGSGPDAGLPSPGRPRLHGSPFPVGD